MLVTNSCFPLVRDVSLRPLRVLNWLTVDAALAATCPLLPDLPGKSNYFRFFTALRFPTLPPGRAHRGWKLRRQRIEGLGIA